MKSSWFTRLFPSDDLTLPMLRASANRAGPQAQNNLGIFLSCSERFSEEAAASVECFRQAAEQGDTVAQYNLALSYQKGNGVAKDGGEAQRWFLKAAEAGDGSAQFYLGIQYHRESLALEASEELKIEALKWLLLAAEQGHHNAERSCEPLILTMTQEQTTETN